MLVPSLACPAACSYCFGPHEGRQRMDGEILQAVVAWQKRMGGDRSLEITFHGGEPLVPGADFYRQALPLLRDGLAPRRVRFVLQSNLWLLDDALCDLFRDYGVAIGTSLDGPQAITDAQRGEGYYRRTMDGIQRARRRGLEVGCICTFTRASLPHQAEIFDFFVSQGLNFTLHAALPSLRDHRPSEWAIDAAQHGQLMVDMLDRYLPNLSRVRIATLDSLCRSVSSGQGEICTFGDCLGGYLAVGPDGGIYPCQRFTGLPEFALANVRDCPSQADLETGPTWRMLANRQERIAEECAGCAFLSYCRGGCPYDALAEHGGRFNGSLKDPHCPSYQRIFRHISDQALREVFSAENLAEVTGRRDPQRGLLRRGRLLNLMRGGAHPLQSARQARELLAAVALAANPPEEAARRLHLSGVVRDEAGSLASLRALDSRLRAPVRGFVNLYLHVTFDCNLRCAHCYASAGERQCGHTPPEDLARACQQAAAAGFRHAVITGGEPLAHPHRADLLDALAGLRAETRPLLTVLRTNLSVPLDAALLRRVAVSTDQVVVSLDGDQTTHDARRGAGSYAVALANLRALVDLRAELGARFTDLSLAAVLPAGEAGGAPGDAVRAVARELGIRRTRFRPLLPIGRAAELGPEIVPETLWGYLGAEEMLSYGFSPAVSCGMGQNLYVEPDGQAFPCYAWHGSAWSLGNIYAPGGLDAVINSPRFRGLAAHTVHTNRGCQACALRYLCGGACRAWNRLPAAAQTDLDAPPLDCAPLHARARSLLLGALALADVDPQTWVAAGLPLPEKAPEMFATIEMLML